jgi:flagellar hook-associated protein 1 FlgK
MGLLNSALHIGRNAIQASQGALQIAGNNISGATSPDYTRLSPQLDPLHGTPTAEGLQPGAGVALTGIRRNIDEALEGRLRLASAEFESALVQQASLAQLETYFDDINGSGVGAKLSSLLSSFDDLANNPEDTAVRDLVLADATELVNSLHGLRGSLAQLSADADAQIEGVVREVNRLLENIAELNRQITRSEAGANGQDNALRDQRDALLREVGQYFDITVRRQSNGSVNIYVGSESLVQGNTLRRLSTVRDQVDGATRTSVRFEDANAQLSVRGGRLGGLITSRDQHGFQQIAELDRLAGAVIADVNRLHADGQGLTGFTELTGAVSLLDPAAALDAASSGLAGGLTNGSFFLTTFDEVTGTPTAHRIDVQLGGATGSSLESIVADINSRVNGVTASVTADNRLQLSAASGFTFAFGYDGQTARSDTSGALSALGVNTLFTGTDASDIAVNETVLDRPELLAASSVFLSGDALNASRIAELDHIPSALLGGTSLNGFYNSIANAVAVSTAEINDEAEAASGVYLSLSAQRESISGVNLDEEAVSLLKYQRSFQGAARFISVVDELIGELVAIIR